MQPCAQHRIITVITCFQFDTNYDGYIATHDLRRFVRNSATSFGLSRQEADALLQNIDKNGDHLLDFAEFCTLVYNMCIFFFSLITMIYLILGTILYISQILQCFLHEQLLQMSKAKKLRMRHVLFRAAQMVVPRSSRTVPFNYLQQYNCFPPPLFMICISILEASLIDFEEYII